MPSIVPITTAMLLFLSSIHAHFIVQHPPTVAPFDDDKEGTSPCGGYFPSIDDVVINDFHVDGEAVATTLTHPQSSWLYRVTTDPTPTKDSNWTEVYPIFEQSGAGAYCSPQVTVPHEFIGKKGYFGIVSHAVDGFLFQCCGAHFVEGIATPPDDCKNGSSVSGDYTDDAGLSSNPSDPGSGTVSSPEHAPNAGISNKSQSFQALGGMLMVGMMVVLGAMFVV
ncbi:hypothetical protein F4804DRAFT_315632 [Jackrogersella minutella]|nr:hypothetical protein F4804DRAFT_315632 [Jackrogersella minutella]